MNIKYFLCLLLVTVTSASVSKTESVNESLWSVIYRDHAEFFSKSSLNCFCSSPWTFVKNLGFSDVQFSSDSGDGQTAVAMQGRRIRPPYLLLVPILAATGYILYKKYYSQDEKKEIKKQD